MGINFSLILLIWYTSNFTQMGSKERKFYHFDTPPFETVGLSYVHKQIQLVNKNLSETTYKIT